MDTGAILRALADETRMKIIKLLLQRNYCVRALARSLNLSEATVSGHLKVLRQVGLLVGERRGYYMHYAVDRALLHELAASIDAWADIERETCSPEHGGCVQPEQVRCHLHAGDGDEAERRGEETHRHGDGQGRQPL